MNDTIITTTSREENRERWRGLVEEQRAGRESKRAFCRGRGISYPRFLAWSKRFAGGDDLSHQPESLGTVDRMGIGSATRSAEAFCELRVGGPAAHGRNLSPAAFEIALIDGVVVRVSPGFDEMDLARLLRVVRVVGATGRDGETRRVGETGRDGATRESIAPKTTARTNSTRATTAPSATAPRSEATRPC